jgi:2-polyprenyl-6-methoxyphenol hydroxylase-like FAD-dependent oxidoreductase
VLEAGTIGMEAAFLQPMRCIKLTGREVTVVRAIGFTESMLGTEIQDFTRMEMDDVTDILNGLISAGFVESIPYYEEVQLAEMPVTAFELNPSYVHELKEAVLR